MPGSLIMQEHLAHDVVERLGELGCVQFTDVRAAGGEMLVCFPVKNLSRCS